MSKILWDGYGFLLVWTPWDEEPGKFKDAKIYVENLMLDNLLFIVF